jgi:hypothetical protein
MYGTFPVIRFLVQLNAGKVEAFRNPGDKGGGHNLVLVTLYSALIFLSILALCGRKFHFALTISS